MNAGVSKMCCSMPGLERVIPALHPLTRHVVVAETDNSCWSDYIMLSERISAWTSAWSWWHSQVSLTRLFSPTLSLLSHHHRTPKMAIMDPNTMHLLMMGEGSPQDIPVNHDPKGAGGVHWSNGVSQVCVKTNTLPRCLLSGPWVLFPSWTVLFLLSCFIGT